MTITEQTKCLSEDFLEKTYQKKTQHNIMSQN